MKKSLFGYKKAQVNAVITELRETIKMNETRIAALEEKYAQTQKTLQEKNLALDNMSNELDRYICQSSPESDNSGGPERSLANVGEIYMLAYDSASTIIKASQKNVEEFMDNMLAQSESAEEQTKKMLANMQKLKTDFQNTVSNITSRAKELQDELSSLIIKTSNSLLSFKNFDMLREEVRKNIDQQMYECLQKSKKLLRQQDIPEDHPLPTRFEALRKGYAEPPAAREGMALIHKIPERLPGIQRAYGEPSKFYSNKFGKGD